MLSYLDPHVYIKGNRSRSLRKNHMEEELRAEALHLLMFPADWKTLSLPFASTPVCWGHFRRAVWEPGREGLGHVDLWTSAWVRLSSHGSLPGVPVRAGRDYGRLWRWGNWGSERLTVCSSHMTTKWQPQIAPLGSSPEAKLLTTVLCHFPVT